VRPDLWELHGADIHPMAFGLHSCLFDKSIALEKENYISSLRDYCGEQAIDFVIPGSDQTAKLISQDGLHPRLVSNSPDLVSLLADKRSLCALLSKFGYGGFPTWDIRTYRDAFYPAVIKPAKDSGGSAHCYLADSHEQARYVLDYMLELGLDPIIQEYLPGRELTVGVLCNPDGTLDGSIAMERISNSKLTVRQSTFDGYISTGYSQGTFTPWKEMVNGVCERLAINLKSSGPLNFQGRVDKKGHLRIFEINARFSASCYLRSLAGFNEPHRALMALLGQPEKRAEPKCITVLRSLTETVVKTEV
jgi:carbamoyl-phosphate synthase large subunit